MYAQSTDPGTSDRDGGEASETKEDVSESFACLDEALDLIAATSLVDLDATESFGVLEDAYPEFEMYQAAPPSPVWSYDNYSNMSPYSAEDEYLAARRCWHEEANDPVASLPDHSSDQGYTISSGGRSDEERPASIA